MRDVLHGLQVSPEPVYRACATPKTKVFKFSSKCPNPEKFTAEGTMYLSESSDLDLKNVVFI